MKLMVSSLALLLVVVTTSCRGCITLRCGDSSQCAAGEFCSDNLCISGREGDEGEGEAREGEGAGEGEGEGAGEGEGEGEGEASGEGDGEGEAPGEGEGAQ